jgi:hypothetical protein
MHSKNLCKCILNFLNNKIYIPAQCIFSLTFYSFIAYLQRINLLIV